MYIITYPYQIIQLVTSTATNAKNFKFHGVSSFSRMPLACGVQCSTNFLYVVSGPQEPRRPIRFWPYRFPANDLINGCGLMGMWVWFLALDAVPTPRMRKRNLAAAIQCFAILF